MEIISLNQDNVTCNVYSPPNLLEFYETKLTNNVICLHETTLDTFKFFLNFESKTPVNVRDMKSTLDAIYESNCLVATNFRDGKYGVHFIFPIKVTEAEASTMLQKILDKYPGTKIKQPLRTIYSLKSHRTKDVYTPWGDHTAKRDAETLVKYSIL
jgi:hypothetical protein